MNKAPPPPNLSSSCQDLRHAKSNGIWTCDFLYFVLSRRYKGAFSSVVLQALC